MEHTQKVEQAIRAYFRGKVVSNIKVATTENPPFSYLIEFTLMENARIRLIKEIKVLDIKKALRSYIYNCSIEKKDFCFFTSINCTLNIKKTIELWNKYFFIYKRKEKYSIHIADFQYGEEKSIRTDKSLMFGSKCTISKKQAHELIRELDLKQYQNSIFKTASTWRRKADYEELSKY